ncbi:uncharacterized protein LOC108099897 [Drosophila ficusphila]|uniref:uncharacterized protein LOC108099897 n=1 Tax=Drosophila ficusphila TaxID=30025 RepID=UPI0007E7CD68|nr:uncharacterized protein LOC108099897 [Drosophila ficusphila]
MGWTRCSEQQFGRSIQANNMKSVIILLAFVALCHSAPLEVKDASTEALSRPSPISPDVISDPKPAEKVVLLKDTPVVDREKREAHHEEGHKVDDKPQVEDLSLPHAKPVDAHTAELPKKKEKRETVQKPDSVKAHETLQHNPARHEELHKQIATLAEKDKDTKHRHQRDIPVPTQTKATAEPAAPTKPETGSTTPASHLNIPHPIPVAELFEKNKQKASSSSEESKESKEKAKA